MFFLCCSVRYCTPGGGGGGILIFSHIRRLWLFFWVQNSEFQYFLGFSENEYFLGYEDFMDIFFGGGGGSSQNWASFRLISMHFRVFFKVKGTELGYFFGLLKFQIFFGVLDIPDNYFG